MAAALVGEAAARQLLDCDAVEPGEAGQPRDVDAAHVEEAG